MKVDVRHSPAYAVAYCYLAADESVRAESGAMAAMSGGIAVKADAGPGGIAKGIMRKTLGHESFFMTRFTAQVHGAWVAVASKFPGDIKTVQIDADRGMVCESGSLLAMSDGLSEDIKFAGVSNILMREGATMLHVHGTGTALLATYGGIEEFALEDGQTLIFDTGHVVAYSQGMSVRVGPLSGLVTAKLSGEGLVAEITGPGRVFVQTRALVDLAHWLLPDREKAGKD
jgi:uncharacterized protein (TIGR00266 family)